MGRIGLALLTIIAALVVIAAGFTYSGGRTSSALERAQGIVSRYFLPYQDEELSELERSGDVLLEFRGQGDCLGCSDVGRPEALVGWDAEALYTVFSSGLHNFESVGPLPDTALARRMSRGVGRVMLFRGDKDVQSPCTGTLIDENHVLTAGHCFWDNKSAVSGIGEAIAYARAEMHFGFLEGGLNSPAGAKFVSVCLTPEPVEVCNKGQCTYGSPGSVDYAIMRIDKSPDRPATEKGSCEAAWDKATSRAYGYRPLDLAALTLEEGSELMMLHHPGGQRQMLTRRNCKVMKRESGADVRHKCDTLQGSSGAPVISTAHEAVVGLHIEGFRTYSVTDTSSDSAVNRAIEIAELAQISPIIGGLADENPMTAEQQRFVDWVEERAALARSLLEDQPKLSLNVSYEAAIEMQQRADGDVFRETRYDLDSLLIAALDRTENSSTDKLENVRLCQGSETLIGRSSAGELQSWNIGRDAQLAPGKAYFPIGDNFQVSPDCRSVVEILPGNVRLRNLESGAQSTLALQTQEVFWDDSNQFFALNGAEESTIIVSAQSGEEVWRSAQCDFAAGLSLKGARVATSCLRGELQLWDLDRRVLIFSKEGWFDDVAISNDENFLAAASQNETLIWDIRTGEPANPEFINPLEHRDSLFVSPRIAAFSSDDYVTVITGKNGPIAWATYNGLITGQLPRQEVERIGEYGIASYAFGMEPGLIALGYRAGKAIIWNAEVFRLVSGGFQIIDNDELYDLWTSQFVFKQGPDLVFDGNTGAMDLTSDGRGIVIESDAGVYFWRLPIPEWIPAGPAESIRPYANQREGAARTPDSQWSARIDRRSIMVEFDDGSTPDVEIPIDGGIQEIALLPDARSILVTKYNKPAQLVDITNPDDRVVFAGLEMPEFWSISPGGQHVLLANREGSVGVWGLSGQMIAPIYRAPEDITFAGFAGDDSMIAIATAGGDISILEVPSQRQLGSFSSDSFGFANPIVSIAFPDGSASASDAWIMTQRGTLHVWDWRNLIELSTIWLARDEFDFPLYGLDLFGDLQMKKSGEDLVVSRLVRDREASLVPAASRQASVHLAPRGKPLLYCAKSRLDAVIKLDADECERYALKCDWDNSEYDWSGPDAQDCVF